MRRLLIASFALIASLSLASAQAILQGGPWVPGHVPQYAGSTAQPAVVDGGPAQGGATGVNPSEFGFTARGTGTPPYVGQGTGPYGSIGCLYDAPTTNANGYHFLCLSPNASNGSQAGGLIAYGAGGIASQLPLNFNVNGTAVNPVSCSGSPTSSFAVINGIVTHC